MSVLERGLVSIDDKEQTKLDASVGKGILKRKRDILREGTGKSSREQSFGGKQRQKEGIDTNPCSDIGEAIT